jgi:hypothetical protein
LSMLNTAIHQLQDNGTLDRLKERYAAKNTLSISCYLLYDPIIGKNGIVV